MTLPDNSDEQDFPLLEALAKTSARDFRLGQFMRELGMDERQPTLFYRALIKEVRGNDAFIDTLLKDLFGKEEIIAKLRADLAVNEERVRTLATKLRSLQNGTRQKTESLEKERQDLLAAASELQDKVWKYDALIQLLKGEIKPTGLKAISDLFWDTYSETQRDRIAGRPLPDPAHFDKIREKLREEFRKILQIPKDISQEERDQLKKEWQELKKQKNALVEFIRRMYGGEG